jgi:hypothetical protein
VQAFALCDHRDGELAQEQIANTPTDTGRLEGDALYIRVVPPLR